MTVEYQNLSEAGTASASEITIPAPDGFSAGDLLVVFITKDDDVLINEHGDWTTLHRVVSGTGCAIYCAWRIAEEGDTGWTWTGDSEAYYGAILRFTGHDPLAPINISDVAVATNNAPTAPDVLTTIDGCMIFQAFGADDDDVPYTVPGAPFSEKFNDSYTTTGGAGGCWLQSSAGQTGTGIFGMAAAEEWGAVTVAIQPAWEPPVSEIDVGAKPIDRAASTTSGVTYVDKNNPANASGILHSIKVYANTNITGLRVGTFYTTNGNTLKCRDSVLIGAVTAGAIRTFTELSITVVEGDYIGCYFSAGLIEEDTSGFDGFWNKLGEYIDPEDEETYFFTSTTAALSLYGYGDIVAAPTVTTQAVSGIAHIAAIGNGNITETGDGSCTKRGICWNTIGNPTVADDKSEEEGSFSTGAFIRPMTGLTPEEHYYVKAYAYNSTGYGYGSQVEFDTIATPDLDVGADPIDRVWASIPNFTKINRGNPANATGTLHTVIVYANEDITGLRVGTFYTTNGDTLKCRDSELVGDAPTGLYIFTELSIAVQAGDYIGAYWGTGEMESDVGGFAGAWAKEGEYIDPGDEETYFLDVDAAISLIGYGDAEAPPAGKPRSHGYIIG